MERVIHDVIIVGGGPGGLTAGIYAARAAQDVVLIEKTITGGQVNNSYEVENWPGTEKITGSDLAAAFSRHAESYNIMPLQKNVVNIEPGLDCHAVHCEDGSTYEAYSIILATGGNPRKLGVPGEKEYYGKGVSYCAVCDGFFYRNKTVVVVGGGDTAVEDALYLSKIAEKVFLVHRRDALRASMILQKRLMNEKKIKVLWNTVVSEINADNMGVNGVLLQNTTTGEHTELAADGVFIFIGFEPDNSLVPAGTKLNGDGYVMTDMKCETSITGIFAIGDLAEKYARQIVTAAADGCTAALAAARYVDTRKAASA